jgi:adenine-specific DNA glycosylase
VFASEELLLDALRHDGLKKTSSTKGHLTDTPIEMLAPFKHVLTHKDLHCHVAKVVLKQAPHGPASGQAGAWWTGQDWENLGLPQPVRHLLSSSL